MHNDLDRNAERIAGSEETRAKQTGFGTSKQGQAIRRQHHDRLAELIVANRADPARREKVVWGALRGLKVDDLAVRLLTAGITVVYADDLGVDSEGDKNFRAIALWIARNLASIRDRALALKVGVWGINRLCELPIFTLRDDILELVLTDRLDDFLDKVLVSAIKINPLLVPSADPPRPWTQVRTGGLPAGHWAQVPLIRDHHKSIEDVAKNAISSGRMRPLLDALHALQSVPFTINEHVLHFLRRMERPPLPPVPVEPS
jgi:hypothetical protein